MPDKGTTDVTSNKCATNDCRNTSLSGRYDKVLNECSPELSSEEQSGDPKLSWLKSWSFPVISIISIL